MQDEERRTLERRRSLETEARYEAGLASLLACLRDGHVTGHYDTVEAEMIGGTGVRVRLGLCERCGLAFWVRDHAAEALARHVAELRAAREAARAQEARNRADMIRNLGGSFRPWGE